MRYLSLFLSFFFSLDVRKLFQSAHPQIIKPQLIFHLNVTLKLRNILKQLFPKENLILAPSIDLEQINDEINR
ncbi:hypothetical protein SAMN05444392_12510 [Seinonella peptonophila]|uniref:Uncharacterized protein n=1 Tax=Seinonella peptonophila TaxID=112248 RepID=A0A1M5BK21_9BACL|nr:hypothetical protein SAMN05444392_12510 [Seinonella peptonophila]